MKIFRIYCAMALIAGILSLMGCQHHDSDKVLIQDHDTLGQMSRTHDEDIYSVDITQAGLYQFEMRSDTLDSYLELTGADIEVSNDDHDGDYDARIVVFLQPGRYRLSAQALEAKTGRYHIRYFVRTTPEAETLDNTRTLTLSEPVTGVFIGKPQRYHLTIAEPVIIKIRIDSDDFEPATHLADARRPSDEAPLYSVENGQPLIAPIPAGHYVIIIDTSDSNAGLYTLVVDEMHPTQPDSSRDISSGALVSGHISEQSINHYDLTIPETGHYTIDLISNDFDAFLAISGENIEENDDDGYHDSFFHSRLSLDLPAGRYRLDVSSLDHSESGQYVLCVSAPNQPTFTHVD